MSLIREYCYMREDLFSTQRQFRLPKNGKIIDYVIISYPENRNNSFYVLRDTKRARNCRNVALKKNICEYIICELILRNKNYWFDFFNWTTQENSLVDRLGANSKCDHIKKQLIPIDCRLISALFVLLPIRIFDFFRDPIMLIIESH